MSLAYNYNPTAIKATSTDQAQQKNEVSSACIPVLQSPGHRSRTTRKFAISH